MELEQAQWLGCSVHISRQATAVCTSIDHRPAPLMCEECLFTHSQRHRTTPISSFIQQVNQSRTDILNTLRQGLDSFEDSKYTMIGRIERISQQISNSCNNWIRTIEEHYEECQKWLEARIFQHASSLINTGRSMFSSDISRNISFYLSRDELAAALHNTISQLSIEEIDGLYQVVGAAENIKIYSYCKDVRSEVFLNAYEPTNQQARDGPQEVDLMQIPKQRNSSRNRYQQPQLCDFFTQAQTPSHPYFPNIDQLVSQHNAFAWSNALKTLDVVVQGDTAELSDGNKFTRGSTRMIEQVVFMEASLSELPSARWALSIDKMNDRITMGFGEVTEKSGKHRYYCFDFTGKCHTNVPYTYMEGFAFSSGEVVEYQTRALEDKLLVECRVDNDRRTTFQILNPSKQLRFFVALTAIGDKARLIDRM